MTLQDTLIFLKDSIYTVVGELTTEVWVNNVPVHFRQRLTGEYKTLSKGDKWGSLFDCGWFHFTGRIPIVENQEVPVLLIDVNGELLLIDNKGKALRGLTNQSSTFDKNLGEPVKRVFRLTTSVCKGNLIDFWADASCNDLFGELKGNGTLKQADVALCREDIRRIYYDFESLISLMAGIQKEDQQYQKIKSVLDKLSFVLVGLSETGVSEAISILESFYSCNQSSSNFIITAIGHSHLDLAWLWPIRETRRKIARTLSTVFELMDRYPDYVYGISQPQLLTWVKTDYPDLYLQLKEKVNEGRIEALGAMWVESDTNLPSGESLVRQIFYGKRFWKDEFGLDIDNLWLPDAFGFSGGLPQILKLSRVDFFSTMKLSLNRVNKFPFHSFHWKGIDGSTVLAHILPEETYNSPASPGSIYKIVENYQEKEISNHALMVFGIGDGGGGPGAEHLERLDRMNRIAVPACVRQEKVVDFYSDWASESENFPAWEGELYLEKHQGTYTTEGLSKWYNRKMEWNFREWEFIAVLGMLFLNCKYPSELIEESWKEILLYQFHDILPGSSIKWVYDESWQRYGILMNDTEDYIKKSVEAFIKSAGYVPEDNGFSVMGINSLSWEISRWVFLSNSWLRITIPSMGYSVLSDAREELTESEFSWMNSSMENKKIRVKFNIDGSLCSVFDKEFNREFLKPEGKGNFFSIFNDS
ncbi:MAG: alpha-mannosidase, partial [Spirochaetaceae bacterium]|nr:alpha-mannosidase [Spirochaetaceae bacterium]